MSPTWSSSKKEIYNEHESALWFIKSLVEAAISHPDTAYAVVGKIADKIEELNLKVRSTDDDPRK